MARTSTNTTAIIADIERMAAIIQAQEEIARYNDELDKYVTGALVRIYADNGITVHEGGMVYGKDIVKAAYLYNKNVREQFGMRAAYILYEMVDRGFDVRMDMNTYKLIWKGVYNNA